MTDDLPLSRPLDLRRLPADGVTVTVTPTEAERAGLARLMDIPAVPALSASLSVTPAPKGATVSGRLVATVTQVCGVSLEPFDAEITEPIAVSFERGARAESPGEGDLEDLEDRPDPLEGDHIDLGAIVAEFLALAIDPYPRKPGATLPNHETGESAVNPFAALAALKKG
jgi:uncharacterized metal-binding protein YceD (DUF177 family)